MIAKILFLFIQNNVPLFVAIAILYATFQQFLLNILQKTRMLSALHFKEKMQKGNSGQQDSN